VARICDTNKIRPILRFEKTENPIAVTIKEGDALTQKRSRVLAEDLLILLDLYASVINLAPVGYPPNIDIIIIINTPISILKIGIFLLLKFMQLKIKREKTQKGNIDGIIILEQITRPLEIPLYIFWGDISSVIINAKEVKIKVNLKTLENASN